MQGQLQLAIFPMLARPAQNEFLGVGIEIAIDESLAERIIEAIKTASQTGQIGDGKIFVLPLEEAVRIRTGETGASAL